MVISIYIALSHSPYLLHPKVLRFGAMKPSARDLNLACRRMLVLGVPVESCCHRLGNIMASTSQCFCFIIDFNLWVEETKDFIYLTLMASWLVDLPWQRREEPFQFIEYYSGMARVSRLAQVMGYEARGFDISYDEPPSGTSPHSGRANRSAFDINGEAGFLLLGDPSIFMNP